MMYRVGDNKKASNGVDQYNRGSYQCDFIGFCVVITGLFTKCFSPQSPNLFHFVFPLIQTELPQFQYRSNPCACIFSHSVRAISTFSSNLGNLCF